MWILQYITGYRRAGNFFRGATLMFLLCSFIASAITPDMQALGDVLVECAENNEGESKETSEKEEREQETDKDSCLRLPNAAAQAIIDYSQNSSSNAFFTRNIRDKVTTPPPEKV